MRSVYSIATVCALLLLDQSGFSQSPKKPGEIAPATKLELAEGWDEIDQRLVFLMTRLASTEASLDAVENVIGRTLGQRTTKTGDAKRAESGNERMDRSGGGPMPWAEFYGKTAEKFFYHPTDRNSTYHTATILSQQAPKNDNRSAEGVPSRQGLPVHQRPPQFDYIYRANQNAKERAERDAAELANKAEALIERRRSLEEEQSGLWCEIAFRAISHYDLDKKPLYRFEPMVDSSESSSRQHAESMKAAASFMSLALSVIDEAQKDQATTFRKIKPAVSAAREQLAEGWLRLGIDVTDRNTTEGKFAALSKRLDDVASNLSESYVIAKSGDESKDRQRKETFRALLQESLVSYGQIILAMNEMAGIMKDQWKIAPDVNRPIQFTSLASVPSMGAAISITTPDAVRVLQLEVGKPRLYDSSPLRIIEGRQAKLSGWKFTSIPQRITNSYVIVANKSTTIYAFGGGKSTNAADFLGSDASKWEKAKNDISGINVNLCLRRELHAGEKLTLKGFELQICAESIDLSNSP